MSNSKLRSFHFCNGEYRTYSYDDAMYREWRTNNRILQPAANDNTHSCIHLPVLLLNKRKKRGRRKNWGISFSKKKSFKSREISVTATEEGKNFLFKSKIATVACDPVKTIIQSTSANFFSDLCRSQRRNPQEELDENRKHLRKLVNRIIPTEKGNLKKILNHVKSLQELLCRHLIMSPILFSHLSYLAIVSN